MMMDEATLAFVRREFPGLESDWTFFDNAGGSLALARVADRIHDYLVHTSVQLGASYEVSRVAAERVDAARARIAGWIHAASPAEVVLGPTSTVLLDTVARGLRSSFQPGDEIIVSRAEHDANVAPWRSLECEGARLVFWEFDPETHELDPAELRRLMSDRTRLVALTHVSNIFGMVHALREIADVAHEGGAQVVVDGVAYAPHREVNVAEYDVDYYVFSLYKVYGPHHAVMFGKHEALLALDPISFLPKDRVPQKLEPGNVNYELTHGAVGIIEYLEELGRCATGDGALAGAAAIRAGYGAIESQEAVVGERLLAYLRERPGVRIFGAPSMIDGDRVPTISFTVEGRTSSDIVRDVEKHKIGIRYGDFYARQPIDSLDLRQQEGVVRVSMVHYNTVEEVDRLIAALDTTL